MNIIGILLSIGIVFYQALVLWVGSNILFTKVLPIPVLTYLQVFVVILLVSFLKNFSMSISDTSKYSDRDSDELQRLAVSQSLNSFVYCTVTLLFFYLTSLFI